MSENSETYEDEDDYEDQKVVTSLDLAEYIKLNDLEYNIIQRGVSIDNAEVTRDFLIVNSPEKNEKMIMSLGYLEKLGATYLRNYTVKDLIKDYLELSCEDEFEKENIKLSVRLCGEVGVDAGSRDCIMFADGMNQKFDFEGNYISYVYDDGKYAIIDGQDFDIDLYIITKSENIIE